MLTCLLRVSKKRCFLTPPTLLDHIQPQCISPVVGRSKVVKLVAIEPWYRGSWYCKFILVTTLCQEYTYNIVMAIRWTDYGGILWLQEYDYDNVATTPSDRHNTMIIFSSLYCVHNILVITCSSHSCTHIVCPRDSHHNVVISIWSQCEPCPSHDGEIMITTLSSSYMTNTSL